ncbi:unnamed protein product [Paramecium sonneborni]|uniref:NACHT domain-containing protein n=1 Tax=Paramecium sonneborni TaxID=65129 RepID=A0A8S1PMG9_9CILI|nr:unnamed protein product [Paramecium sonneborni]
MNKTISILRGGGCGTSQISPQDSIAKTTKKDKDLELENFITKFDFYVEQICTRASVAVNQSESQEIMIALQWFFFQEESIYKLNKSAEKVMKSYNLILEGIRKLLKSCQIYIKTDQFKCLYILQTTASLSKVIFSFHIMNDERFMKYDLQKEFLDISDELKQQMEIEKNDMIQIQMELYLFLTKTSFEMAPNNSNEREEILKGCLSGIIQSIIQMKPSAELLESLFQGACLLYKMYSVQKNRKQYEVYFQIDILQWEIISYFKYEKQKNLEEVLLQIQAIHENLVQNSNNWKNHFLWIQMIAKILMYNPLLSKKKLQQLIDLYNYKVDSNQIWKEYQNKGLLIQLNKSSNSTIILLNKLQNKESILQFDRIILEDCFKEWENFLLLKDFLLNDYEPNINFTFCSYLQCKLKVGCTEFYKNDNILVVSQIQTFFHFIISNKLLTLFNENYEKLGLVIKSYQNLMKHNIQFNKKIQQAMQNSEINKMILNFKQYFLNTQNIIKFVRLNQNKQNCQTQLLEFQNELNNFQQLKYLIKNLRIRQMRKINLKFKMTEEKVKIQMELTKLTLRHSFLDNFKKKLLALLAVSLNQQNFLKTASSLIQLITNSWKQLEQLERLEVTKLQKNNNMIQYFEVQLNKLFLDYEEIDQELNHDNNESMFFLKEIIQIKQEIAPLLNPQNSKEIKGLIKYIQNLRFKHLKLHLKLDTIKKSFLNMLAQTSPEELQQLLEFINLNEFLFSVIKNYPKRLNYCNGEIEKVTMVELKSLQFTEQDYQSTLSKQKGLIEYLQFCLSIEKQMISKEELDLELIQKELGYLFIEESPSQMFIQTIESLFLTSDELVKNLIEEKLNLSELILIKEKFYNCLKELGKIKKSRNHQSIDQIGSGYCNQLANQTETVIRILETFEKSDKEIFLILLKEELMNFKNLLSINQQEIKEKDEKIKKQSNQIEEVQSPQQLLIQRENDQMLEKQSNDDIEQNDQNFNFRSNENYNTYLKCMIKLVQLQQQKITEKMKGLDKLLEVSYSFSNDIDLIQKQTQDTQEKCSQIFQCRFRQIIMSFEKLTSSPINLQQKKNENFLHYFGRIQSNLQLGINDFEITQIQTNICDFLNTLKMYFSDKLKQPIYFANTKIEQENMIHQIRKLYLETSKEEENDYKSNQELDLFDTLNKKFKDYHNNEEWKIKQGLVFTIIQISSNCFTNSIIQFCQKALIQLWISEKDQRVRNLLKNENLINMQMQILKKDWQTQHNRVSGEMQQMLMKIDQLQEEVSHEANLNKRDQQLRELGETTKLLDEYIENISEMGQQLRLITDFVNHIRKNLLRVEGKINEMNEQLNRMDNDVKSLRGKSVEQLFEIRKWKVLKEAAYKNVKSIYVPLKTQEKGKNEQSYLMNLDQFDDKEGEVNEFLQEEKTVMLIHGIAGSGKSTTAKKIEEIIWKLHEVNKKIGNQTLIPIYISLPSLKNPVFQAVEETLRSDEYGFEALQLKECKEKLQNKEFRFMLIMDSYDEMKLENIQKNLYINNKLKQNWSDPLVIFTTRSEIFTSINYIDWFAPEEKTKFKEIQLLKFDKHQTKEYLKKFTIQSIKMQIFEIYEWQIQITKGCMDINKFELCWEQLKQSFLKFEGSKLKSEALLNQKQIENILIFLKDDNFFALKSNEALRSLRINLQKLWSIEKYFQMMKQINLNRLVETPYMIEIIVQVLPQMMIKATEITKMKENFINNFSKMFKKFLKSKYLIYMNKQQKNKHQIKQLEEFKQDSIGIQEEEFQVIVKKIVFRKLKNCLILKQARTLIQHLQNLQQKLRWIPGLANQINFIYFFYTSISLSIILL